MLLDAWASHYATMSAGQEELFEDDDFDLDAVLEEAERRADGDFSEPDEDVTEVPNKWIDVASDEEVAAMRRLSRQDDDWEEVESWSVDQV